MSPFEVEVIKKVPVKVKVQISTEQEKFCKLFVRDPKLQGKSFECYMKVYGPDLEPHQTPELVRRQAKELLADDRIISYLNTLLEEDGFNDASVDKHHLFLINQFGDFSTKMKAIQEYNKLKKRIDNTLTVVVPRPIMDLDDDETIHMIDKSKAKEIETNVNL